MFNGEYEVLIGNCLDTLKTVDEKSIQCVVTSPPYYALRDYGTAQWEGGDPNCEHEGKVLSNNRNFIDEGGRGSNKKSISTGDCVKCSARRIDSQIGLEETPDDFVESLVNVFREVRRVLRDDGVVWLNLGDSYSGVGGASGHTEHTKNFYRTTKSYGATKTGSKVPQGLKPKDMMGIPWRVAFALQADGWYLRQDIIWSKPNPMPASVKDRCVTSHEYIFLLSKSRHYFFDYKAIQQPLAESTGPRMKRGVSSDHKWSDGASGQVVNSMSKERSYDPTRPIASKRNKRSVWTITTKPFAEAHFATYPPDLIEDCILAGSASRSCGDCGTPWARTELGSFRPNCECNGKLAQKEVIIPASMTPQQIAETTWGTNADGEYTGEAIKEYEGTGAQNASDVKKRIIENRTKEKKKTITIYESELDLDKHPITPSIVLDPFGGSGTTAGVAIKHGRRALLCELNQEYADLIPKRISHIIGLENAEVKTGFGEWFA